MNRRICAAALSCQLGVSLATGYKKVMQDGGQVGDLGRLLAALTTYLRGQRQDDLLRRILGPSGGGQPPVSVQ